MRSRDSSVIIVIVNGLDDGDSISIKGSKFSLRLPLQKGLGAQPDFYRMYGPTICSFAGSVADPSLSSTVQK
jgi:hypothetical protein